jgi:hypothetical protein
MFGNAWRRMQRNRSPDLLDIVFVHAVLGQEVARRIRAVHFETVRLAAIGIDQAHVVKHRAHVQQFRVVLQLLAFARECAEQEHAS